MPDDIFDLLLAEAPIEANMVTENLILRLYQPGGVPLPDDPWFHDLPGDDGLTQAQKDLITKGLTDAAIAAALAKWDQSAQEIINDVLAQARSLLASIIEATITKQMVTLQTDQESLAIEVDTWGARIGANAAAIQDQFLTYANDKIALAETIRQVVAGNDTAIAAINTTNLAYVEGDLAIAKRIDTLVSDVGKNQAAIVEQSETQADDKQALAKQITTLQAKVGTDISANLTEMKKVTADQYAATVAQITSFTVTLNGNAASIASEVSARVAGDSGLATRIDNLSVTVGNVNAWVNSVNQARIDGDNALAQSINSVSITANNASYTASVALSVSSQYGGRWSVSLDAYGYVAGLILNNGAAGSGFWVSADSFVVAKPGYDARQGFVVQYVDGVPQLSIQSALIGDANVSTLKIAGNAVTIPNYREGGGGVLTRKNERVLVWQEAIYYPQGTNVLALVTWQAIAHFDSTNTVAILYVDGNQVMYGSVSLLKDFSSTPTTTKQFWLGAGWHTFQLFFSNDWPNGQSEMQRWSITLLGTMR